MLINEVAKLTGLSVRTLHYYHELGLVIPKQEGDTGYRIYEEKQLKSIAHIQFFKELGFSLKEIHTMLSNKQFNSQEVFQLQYRVLAAKSEHLNKQMHRLQQLINQEQKGGFSMSDYNLNFDMNKYEQEARSKWGDDAVDESIFKLNHLSQEEQKELKQQWDNIYSALADQMNEPVNSKNTETIISSYFKLLNRYFGKYNYQAFIGLGELYITDERFTSYIDRYASGLSSYMCKAMEYWGKKQIENS